MSHYEKLSALDASFLHLEDASCHMHVGAILVFEAERLRTEGGGIDVERIRKAVEARLHLVPRFRQRVMFVPFERDPVWVDDDRFRLAYHVRHTALPRPGDERVLKRLAGRIMSQRLDRGRPLWELWVVEGLEGDRFALISKTHHCMVDGVSGADLMALILEAIPNPEILEPEPWEPRPSPSGSQLTFDALMRRVAQPLDVVQAARDVLLDPSHALERVTKGVSAIGETLSPGFSPASETPFQVEVGPHRRIDWFDTRVGDFKEVKNSLGGTLNDVVLATVAGAIRRFLLRRGTDPNQMEIRALVPVSIRSRDQRGALGNRIAQMIAPLPVHHEDPVSRLEVVRQTMGDLKKSKQALGAEILTAISEWTSPNLLVQAVRLGMRGRPANLTVTNVPGPQLPLYLLEAKMLATYPVVPLFEHIGLVIGLFSYDGGLYWGLTADWEGLPDLHDLIDDLGASIEELQDAARAARESATSRA